MKLLSEQCAHQNQMISWYQSNLVKQEMVDLAAKNAVSNSARSDESLSSLIVSHFYQKLPAARDSQHFDLVALFEADLTALQSQMRSLLSKSIYKKQMDILE